jgi:hypothetical protein
VCPSRYLTIRRASLFVSFLMLPVLFRMHPASAEGPNLNIYNSTWFSRRLAHNAKQLQCREPSQNFTEIQPVGFHPVNDKPRLWRTP